MKLKRDAESYNYKIYAHGGDEVKMIADCGNVLIVEDINGKRFPIKADNILKANETPEEPPKKIIIPPEPVRKNRNKSKPHPVANQQTLF